MCWFWKNSSRQVIAMRILLPVQKVTIWLSHQTVLVDRRTSMRAGRSRTTWGDSCTGRIMIFGAMMETTRIDMSWSFLSQSATNLDRLQDKLFSNGNRGVVQLDLNLIEVLVQAVIKNAVDIIIVKL